MDVCAKLRGILGMRKIGHAGTLDPMAEGVLPVALGRATKDVDRIGDGTKTYVAGMLLGRTTDTQDTTGTICSEYSGVLPDAETVKKAALSFLGRYAQLTPMYSARKVAGKKLYEYARAGKEVERKRKEVEILELCVEEVNLPHVRLRVTCTKGTYIRTLCADIGEKLGCGACMESLLRTRVGDFTLASALKLSEVEALRGQHAVDDALVIEAPTAVALGKFDGTHIGHQRLFRELLRTAQAEHLRSMVLILDPSAKRIEDREARKAALYAMGIDYVIELKLSEELMHMSAEDFLQKMLIGRFSMHAIVAGRDVTFGCGKRGNAAFLTEHAKEDGFSVHLIDKVETALPGKQGALVVSSSRVREELGAGNMENVAMLLGHPWRLSGRVVHGRHLGGPVMGFPTMNLAVPEGMVLPPYGVYAVKLTFLESGSQKKTQGKAPVLHAFSGTYYGIANLGTKPTVTESGEQPKVNLETYAFSFAGDAYGQEISVELLHFIRPERKFDNLEELKEQLLEKDIAAAKKYLAVQPGASQSLQSS